MVTSMSNDLQRLEKKSVREIPTKRLVHAMNSGQALHDDMHAWWAETDQKPRWVLSEDGRVLELVVNLPDMPPVDTWHLRANDIAQNLRGVMDAVARYAAMEFVGRTSKSKIKFPTAMLETDVEWQQWKGHKVFPTDVVERFRQIQPFATRRLTLDGLRRFSNSEKHDFEVTASFLGSSAKIPHEVIPTSCEFPDAEIRNGQQTVLRVTYPQPVEAPELGHDDYAFSVWLRVAKWTPPLGWESEAGPDTEADGDKADIRLLEALHNWSQEVAWALAFIAGQYPSATEAPQGTLNLS